MDKQRIEEDSKYQAKQRIFFGALVVLGAVLMVTMFGKKESLNVSVCAGLIMHIL